MLPQAPLHSEFLDMVFDLLGPYESAQAVADAFAPYVSQKEGEKFRQERDANNLICSTVEMLDKSGSRSAEKALRVELGKAFKGRGVQLKGNRVYRKRTKHLRDLLKLSEEDLAVLECFACYQVSNVFESYCDSYPYSDWAALFSVALGMSLSAVRARVAIGGTLTSKGLVEVCSNRIEANNAVFEFLAGLSNDFFSGDEFSLVKKGAFPLESFPITDKEHGLLVDSLRNPSPCHLFFYGRPGTGKTELAKTLAAEAGQQAFLVKYGDDGDEQERRRAITATFGIAPSDAVVIIDEADGLLNTATLFQKKSVDKGWINNFMDECKHKVIWIANETRSIETSVLRRFSYSLEFKKFTKGQRASVWNTQLKRHSLRKVIRPSTIERLARYYEVDAGGIASALKAAENVFTNRTPSAAEVKQTLGQLLEHHEKLSGVDRKKKKLNRLSPNYDVNALHTDLPPMELLASLKARQQKIKNGHRPFSANIMFWGVPGTGKTEFAKYIAQELGKELLVKRMSDLQSMYVGQTEKQIAAAFEEAEKEGAVLFLDEADSLILDRKTASRSWESSQTNEVLT